MHGGPGGAVIRGKQLCTVAALYEFLELCGVDRRPARHAPMIGEIRVLVLLCGDCGPLGSPRGG